MSTAETFATSDVNWFVGASYGGKDDRTSQFLAEGVWVNGYDNKYLDLVRSMRPGERIAIKSTYTRKRGLPFDNKEQPISVMAIKAIGTVTENLNDGRHVRVDWTKLDPVHEWYFYTHRATVWRVRPGEWMADGLIAFTFEGKPQDINRFRSTPYWQDRIDFKWTSFYENVADKLLPFRENRSPLVEALRKASSRMEGLGYLTEDQYADGTTGFVRDICPFTTIGTFNRGLKDFNRKAIASELAEFLGVEEPIPASFEGIPLLNNMKSWFFPYEAERSADHIQALWDVFAASLVWSENDGDEERAAFANAFDNANGRPRVAWNLTMGLYWIRPWSFLSLDKNSRSYITEKLGVPIGRHGPKKLCNSADYLEVMDTLYARFQEDSYPVASYPEVSLESWHYAEPKQNAAKEEDESEDEMVDEFDDLTREAIRVATPLVPYTSDDLLKDGSFLSRSEIERLLNRLRTKKNLILQGPPGTGKTWTAKRLGFLLMGQKDENKLRAVQFHPNLSYEDFVRGWRPTGDGKLNIAEGIFMEAIKAASKDFSSQYVVVIEEINRGNPAQIFGELITLLEAGKRTPSEALELAYPDADGRRLPVHIPENLYVIGTMNIADRSLALVDLAFRRRFAFVTLEPKLGDAWRHWVVKECGVDPTLVGDIERRITALNQQIADELGNQFRIGHSYVTPPHRLESGTTKEWFRQVAETEIGPLLEEYWFDAPKRAEEALDQLIREW